MSIFKDSLIILKVIQHSEKNLLYSALSYEYGKIIVSKKYSSKEKTLDVGYHIQAEIEVSQKHSIHTIKHIKIWDEFLPEHPDFALLYNYLLLISLLEKELPAGIPHKEIFNTTVELLQYEKKHEKKYITEEKILFIQIKICFLLGIFSYQGTDAMCHKILGFIQKNKPKDILRLTGISSVTKEELKKIGHSHIHQI